jgi:predicted dehydrogenase
MNRKHGNAPLNFALIGCGRISQTYLEVMATIPECNLVAAADVCKESAQTAANQFGCKDYVDHHQLLNDNHIDAVVICSPPNTHTEIAKCFLENGIHVLCEKPIALTSAQAASIVEQADKNACLFMMASKFRYVDDIIKARGIVSSGILGDIVLFENVFCSKVDMKNRWNSAKDVAGGGVLVDNGSHSVDIARHLVGPIVKVQAEEGKRVQNLEVEDTARLYFRTESGVMGAVDLSWSIYKERESYIDLFGTEGVLSIGWKCSKYRQSEKLDWITFGKGYDKLSAFRKQIENFVGCIKGRELPLITSKEAVESVRVIEAAYESMRMDKWVKVNNGQRAPDSTQQAAADEQELAASG